MIKETQNIKFREIILIHRLNIERPISGMSNFFIMGQIINLSIFSQRQNYTYMKFPLFGIRCHDQIMVIKT